MLAYVFAHRPAPGGDLDAYEGALREFHRRLASARLRGFVSSTTLRIGGGYADWYLLSDSAALDPLNEAAVSGARAAAHASAAGMAVDGVGKLLSLVDGHPDLGARFETRFAKPKGMGYADLYAAVRPLAAGADGTLWRRMMVLGPPPEFTVVSSRPVELPAEMQPEALTREPI